MSEASTALNNQPFLELLASAEEFQVDEIPTDPDVISNGFQTYHVKVRGKPTSAPKKDWDTEELSSDFMLNNADLLIDNEEFVLARNLYSAVLERDIRNQKALMGLGKCLKELGHITSAKKCFQAVHELYHGNEAVFELADCSSREGNDLSAIEYLNSAGVDEFDSEPLRFEAFKLWGNCLNRLNCLEEAEQKYKAALLLNPTSDTLFVNLGTLAIQNKAYEEAERYFERAVQINPRSSKASSGLGIIALEIDNLSLATKHFLESQKKEPGNKVAALQLAAIAHRDQNFEMAKMALADSIRRFPTDNDVRYALASIYFTEENWSDCEPELNHILESEPSHEKAGRLKASIVRQNAAHLTHPL